MSPGMFALDSCIKCYEYMSNYSFKESAKLDNGTLIVSRSVVRFNAESVKNLSPSVLTGNVKSLRRLSTFNGRR